MNFRGTVLDTLQSLKVYFILCPTGGRFRRPLAGLIIIRQWFQRDVWGSMWTQFGHGREVLQTETDHVGFRIQLSQKQEAALSEVKAEHFLNG